MGVVLKYGGTSVSTVEKIRQIASYIASVQEQEPVVVVVSAMGNTTNELLQLANNISSTFSKRELDTLLSTGEQQTIALLAMALQVSGVQAISLTGAQAGFITTSTHTKGIIMDVDISRVQSHLDDNYIVVVAGFQGITETGDITTLGRGGSDTSAVALAAKLGYRCEIYTDVDGIYSVDPRRYKKAKKLEVIRFDEMMEMSVLGAGVMETRAVELAQKYHVELYVGRTLSKKGSGTTIMNTNYLFEEKPITGLSVTDDVTMVTLEGINSGNQIVSDFFQAVSDHNINLDMISQNIDNKNNLVVSFSIHTQDIKDLQDVIETTRRLTKHLHVETVSNLVKISLIGVGMASHFGVAAKVFQTLATHLIPFYHVSTSEISISCTIDKEQTNRAVQFLAEAFSL
jgi:aspartate kinase